MNKLFAGAFTLSVAMAGGVYSVVTYAKQSEIHAYQLKIEMLDRRVVELEREIAKVKTVRLDSKSDGIINAQNETNGLPSVYISSPKSQEVVSQFTDVRFDTTDKLSKGYKIILVIRDPIGQWWSWGQSESGLYPNVQFGTSVDKGQSFEIGVIVTKDGFPKGQPRRSLPTYTSSDFITVVRE